MSNYIQDQADWFPGCDSRSADNPGGLRHSRNPLRVQSIAFGIVLVCLLVSMLQLPVVRSAIYACPALLLVLWLLDGGRMPSAAQLVITAPFIWLVVLFVFYIPMSGLFAWRWTFFVCVYTSIFLFVDFSKTDINLLYLNLVFVTLLAYSWLTGNVLSVDIQTLEKGLTDSHVVTESPLAFPLGLFACFWILKGRYWLGFINFVVTLFAFKRIVLFAMAAFAITLLIPKRVRSSGVYALCGVFVATLVIPLGIEFAYGRFDELLTATTGRSANALSMGRQELWKEVLGRVEFDYADFAVMGVGMDKVIGGHFAKAVWTPFHNDLLAIWLSYGAIGLIIFTGLVLIPRDPEARALATFILTIFLTDNTLIYQHVMIPYLFMLSTINQDRR